MEVKLDTTIIERVERNDLRSDWRAIAKRLQEDEGRWRIVHITERTDRGICEEIRARLARVGCRAQVVALMGFGHLPRPWTGYAVFARIPEYEHLLWQGAK